MLITIQLYMEIDRKDHLAPFSRSQAEDLWKKESYQPVVLLQDVRMCVKSEAFRVQLGTSEIQTYLILLEFTNFGKNL